MSLEIGHIIIVVEGWTGWRKVLIRSQNAYKMVRNGHPTKNFWSIWRDDKQAVKDLGFSVRKLEEGDWQVAHWVDADDFDPTEYDEDNLGDLWDDLFDRYDVDGE